MDRQIRVGSLEDFPDGEARQVELGDMKVVIVRIGDDLFALNDRCSHANYSLSEGEVDGDEGTLECWKHGAMFSLADGMPVTLPATVPVAVYQVDVVGAEVFVIAPGSTS